MSISKTMLASSSTPLTLEFSLFLDYTKLIPTQYFCIYPSSSLFQLFTRLAFDHSANAALCTSSTFCPTVLHYFVQRYLAIVTV